MNIAYKNASEAFEDLFRFIMCQGVDTNVGTKAVYNVGFYLLNPEQRVITTEWRKFSEKYAEREFAWYLSGDRSVEEIKKFAPIWDKMHGGDNIVNSNYGWQWMRNGQLEKCIKQLKSNKDSRQAWLTIFDGKEKATTSSIHRALCQSALILSPALKLWTCVSQCEVMIWYLASAMTNIVGPNSSKW